MEARSKLFAGAALIALTALAGCGGEERQDANEPEGTFRVEVARAELPEDQRLAQRTKLQIAVKNVDDKTIPNIAVTVRGLERREEDPRLADPERPVFVINGQPAQIGGLPEAKAAAPEGGETAFVDTWALGELEPGATEEFVWSLTPVEGGPYRVTYTVSAGLDGEAKAVLPNGQPPRGVFTGSIEDEPPDSRVAEDGRTVIRDGEE